MPTPGDPSSASSRATPRIGSQHNFGPSYPFGYNYTGPSYPFGRNYTGPARIRSAHQYSAPRSAPVFAAPAPPGSPLGARAIGASSGCRSTTRTMRGFPATSPGTAPGSRGATRRRRRSRAGTTSGSGSKATGPSDRDGRDGLSEADGARPDAELRVSHRGSRDARVRGGGPGVGDRRHRRSGGAGRHEAPRRARDPHPSGSRGRASVRLRHPRRRGAARARPRQGLRAQGGARVPPRLRVRSRQGRRWRHGVGGAA